MFVFQFKKRCLFWRPQERSMKKLRWWNHKEKFSRLPALILVYDQMTSVPETMLYVYQTIFSTLGTQIISPSLSSLVGGAMWLSSGQCNMKYLEMYILLLCMVPKNTPMRLSILTLFYFSCLPDAIDSHEILEILGIVERLDERSLTSWLTLWSRSLTAFLCQLQSQQEINIYYVKTLKFGTCFL